MIPIASFPQPSTVTWFGRSDIPLAAIFDRLPDSPDCYSLLALGSGPLEWTILGLEKVGYYMMVDSSPFVEQIMWRLNRGEFVPLTELEQACRNTPDEPNIDLTDVDHLAEGLKKLEAAGTLPGSWSVDHLRGAGISLPDPSYHRYYFCRQDASEFFKQNSKRYSVIQMGNLITQLLKAVGSFQEMDRFYALLAAVKPLAVHIQTSIGDFRRQRASDQASCWPHFLDQIQQAGLVPDTVVLVDAVISSGQLRGSYSLVCELSMNLDLSPWKDRFQAKWSDIHLIDEQLTQPDASWKTWQDQLTDRFVLALGREGSDTWRQISVTASDLEKILKTPEKLVYSRNLYDGLTLFCPNYHP